MSEEQTIKTDIMYEPSGDFAADAAVIRQLENDGIETVWIAERTRNPFFPLTIAAKSTTSIGLATLDAYAIPRSPMVTAQIAWDLARQSRGRFILGLNAHSHASVVERSDGRGHDAVDRMREYIESMRAIWNTFQNDERLRYRGQYYQFRLMAPFFNPGPINHPDITVFLAADDLSFCHLAGEICQGLHVPVLHTSRYLRDEVFPALTRGLKNAGRRRADLQLAVSLLIVTGSTPEETERAARIAKTRIARLASAESGRDFLRYRGWQEYPGQWQQSANPARDPNAWRFVSNEMLREIAVVAEPGDLVDAIRERCQGVADRVILPWNHEDRERISSIVHQLNS